MTNIIENRDVYKLYVVYNNVDIWIKFKQDISGL